MLGSLCVLLRRERGDENIVCRNRAKQEEDMIVVAHVHGEFGEAVWLGGNIDKRKKWG